MTIVIESPATSPRALDAAASTNRSALQAMLRGAAHTCPACGTGRLYAGYLKVADSCGVCTTELHHHRADDAPPYFTIFLVGHLVVFGVLVLEQAYAPEAWIHALIWVPLTLILSLSILPRVKGALVGLQWALKMHGFGTGPDPAQPDDIAPEQPTV